MKVSAETLRKLSIAPNNESYVINTLRFIGAIDAEGNKTDVSVATFNQHDDAAFQSAFGKMVQAAYKELFDLHGEDSWVIETDGLISFFRSNDQTSDLVGRRQATTFQALAVLAGKLVLTDSPKPSSTKPREAKPTAQKVPKAASGKTTLEASSKPDSKGGETGGGQREVGLTLRIEVNLPAGGDQETYDRIFRSIRENLLNAK